MSRPWQDEEVLKKHYIKEQKSTTKVAEELGCSRATILRWLDRHDIETRPQHGFADERLRDAAKMRELYRERGMSCVDIADRFGCDSETVRSWLVKHDIDRRVAGGYHQTPEKLRQEDWMLEQYEEEDKSVQQIADEVGCGNTSVRRWLNRHGAELGPGVFPTGKEHPNWKENADGIYPEYGDNWRKQRGKALERDGWACQRCGIGNESHKEKYNQELHVHHITPRVEYENVEESNELQNLITLCAKCHKMLEGIPIDAR